MVFDKYSLYYDLLYKDKDYRGEVSYIEELIKKYSEIKVDSILDLGCGTGRHDMLLAERGYAVTGVDLSEQMLSCARKHESDRLRFFAGDVRTVDLKKQFDAVISLFHVASYQTKNEDLQCYFNTASKHLKSNGLFIFDFWYGPAVLTDLPTKREKLLENEDILVKRYTTPEMLINENIVKVNFDVNITDKKSKCTENIKEIHSMRYLFLPELEYFLNSNGLAMLDSLKWLFLDEKISKDSWYGLIMAKKKD